MYRPASEHARADLLFEVRGRVLRVQCKTASRRLGVLVVNLTSSWYTPRGFVRRTYAADEIDLVAAYDHDSDRAYLLPIALVKGMRAINLRVEPPRNGQRAGLHFAADYEFPGAVAQLGERCRGTAEAVGSSPISSTITNPENANGVCVGAHEFRERFGWYMQRAAAGEQIHVSRHGRPFVRLLPATEPLIEAGPQAA